MTLPLRVALVGYGTVGRAVAQALCCRGDLRLCLALVVGRAGTPRPSSLPPSVAWADEFQAVLDEDINVVVELIGGLDPARAWIEQALRAGKPVVTANKQLIAEAGRPLAALAARHGAQIRFEGAVGGGIPVVRAIQDGLAGDRLVRIAGILNGTCNYVLTRMEQAGASFEDALAQAQAEGYAEADASADISGSDARAKLAILTAVGLGQHLPSSAVVTESIAGITVDDLRRARSRGRALRQVSRVERHAGGTGSLRASVGPEPVPLDSPLARAAGCGNVIVVLGELGGETIFAGQGAGGRPTAVAVISDLLAVGGHARA